MEVRFVVLSPAGKQRAVPVRLPILVGRADEAKFRIKNDSVSRRHCEFFIEDDVVLVRDLGSTNGTLLDKEQVPASVATAVPPGTVVHVGSVAFRVEYESAGAPQADPHDGGDTLPLAADTATEPAEPEADEEDIPPETADTAFAGLAAAEEPAPDDGGWPTEPEAAAPPDDENLDNFFKSLS